MCVVGLSTNNNTYIKKNQNEFPQKQKVNICAGLAVIDFFDVKKVLQNKHIKNIRTS